MPRNVEMDHITVIVPKGQGQAVLKLAKQKGIINGSISKAYGTSNKELSSELEQTEMIRDLVSLVAATDLAEIFLRMLNADYDFAKRGHGIAYAVNVNEVYAEGLRNTEFEERAPSEFQAITAIFRNGQADPVMAAARAAGATGGTVLEDASALDSDASLFSKGTAGSDEIILIITKKDKAQAIMEAIRENSGLDPASGLVYVQDAHFVYGLKKWTEPKPRLGKQRS